MKKYYKRFESKNEFFAEVAELCADIDLEASIESTAKSPLKVFWYCPKEGKQHRMINLKGYTRLLASKYGLPFQWPICWNQGNILHVYTSEDVFNTEPEQAPETPVVEDAPAVEEVVAEVVEVAEEAVQEGSAPVFDQAHADSLYDSKNVKGSKDALEAYGVQFGIDLKKNKSFANMLKDLVAHIEE